jgi:oleandomycin transport system permease protein
MTTTTAPTPPRLEQQVRPIDGIQQSLTLAWRTLVEVRHQPMILADYSVQAIVFVLLFTFVFGGAVAGDWRDYLSFMLPGMLVVNMLFYTMYVGQGLNSDLSTGVFDRLRSLPIARWAPLAGRIVADQVKQLWSIVLVLAAGMVLGFRLENGLAGLLGAIGLLLAFALAFSWVSVLVGVLARDPERVQIFGFTALFPITFVSNVFVPAETMPGWLQAVVSVNPVSLLTDASRGLLTGQPALEPALWSLVWTLAIMVVCAPVSVWALKRRLMR